MVLNKGIFKCFVLDLFALGCAWHQEKKKKDDNAATKSNCSLNAAVFATPNILYSFLSSSAMDSCVAQEKRERFTCL